MGMVYAEIILKNSREKGKQVDGLLSEKDVHKVNVQAIVDTGAMSLVINEQICQSLGLKFEGEKTARVANGQRVNCKVTEPVEVFWKNRQTVCNAVVMPGAEAVLLGAIPLEGMDLMVNPVSQELVGVHGEKEEFLVF
jgi:clan AA aspartic protease